MSSDLVLESTMFHQVGKSGLKVAFKKCGQSK